MNEQGSNLTRLQMTTIVVLRVLIGWHFLYEGVAKLTKPDWSAAGFLKQARGPLADLFHWMAGEPERAGDREPAEHVGAHPHRARPDPRLLHAPRRRLRASSIILLFYLCNPPFVGYFYSIPTEGSYLIVNKNLVELAALAVVLVTGSGRAAGLDRIIHGLLATGRRPAGA